MEDGRIALGQLEIGPSKQRVQCQLQKGARGSETVWTKHPEVHTDLVLNKENCYSKGRSGKRAAEILHVSFGWEKPRELRSDSISLSD